MICSLSNRIICLAKDLFVVVKWFENENIISQVVRIGEWCDQNGDKVSKNDKSCYICIIWLKGLLVKLEKHGTPLSLYLKWGGPIMREGERYREIIQNVCVCVCVWDLFKNLPRYMPLKKNVWNWICVKNRKCSQPCI